MSKNDNSSGNGCGCFGVVLGALALWALIFGVTIGGKHYGITGCDMDHGVRIDH